MPSTASNRCSNPERHFAFPLCLCVSKNSHRSTRLPCADFGNTEAQSSRSRLALIQYLPTIEIVADNAIRIPFDPRQRVPSVPYSLSPTSRRSAVALAVPLTGIGAEQLRPERRRTVFRPFFSALTKIKEVDPGRHELQCLPF